MSNKHTPAPWSPYLSKDKKTIAIFGEKVGAAQKEVIHWTGFDNSHYPTKQRVANAYLISAAPEMFQALKALVNAYNQLPLVCQGWVMDAKAAIAKAEGK